MTVYIPEVIDATCRQIVGGACPYCGAELAGTVTLDDDGDTDQPGGVFIPCTNCHCAWLVVGEGPERTFVGRAYRDPVPAVAPPHPQFE